jgi:DNA-binding transcriptional MocR family regulator
LLYSPDAGYGFLRTEVSRWLSIFYGCPDDADRICITGSASQNLPCILQVFIDPAITQRVWMAAPCYFLAYQIFEDTGFTRRLRAVPEDRGLICVGYDRGHK